MNENSVNGQLVLPKGMVIRHHLDVSRNIDQSRFVLVLSRNQSLLAQGDPNDEYL